jgi:hypothetical protein
VRLIARDRHDDAQHHVVATVGEPHALPGAREVDRQVGDGKVFD